MFCCVCVCVCVCARARVCVCVCVFYFFNVLFFCCFLLSFFFCFSLFVCFLYCHDAVLGGVYWLQYEHSKKFWSCCRDEQLERPLGK